MQACYVSRRSLIHSIQPRPHNNRNKKVKEVHKVILLKTVGGAC
jgi:hypothetical protein